MYLTENVGQCRFPGLHLMVLNGSLSVSPATNIQLPIDYSKYTIKTKSNHNASNKDHKHINVVHHTSDSSLFTLDWGATFAGILLSSNNFLMFSEPTGLAE